MICLKFNEEGVVQTFLNYTRLIDRGISLKERLDIARELLAGMEGLIGSIPNQEEVNELITRMGEDVRGNPLRDNLSHMNRDDELRYYTRLPDFVKNALLSGESRYEQLDKVFSLITLGILVDSFGNPGGDLWRIVQYVAGDYIQLKPEGTGLIMDLFCIKVYEVFRSIRRVAFTPKRRRNNLPALHIDLSGLLRGNDEVLAGREIQNERRILPEGRVFSLEDGSAHISRPNANSVLVEMYHESGALLWKIKIDLNQIKAISEDQFVEEILRGMFAALEDPEGQ